MGRPADHYTHDQFEPLSTPNSVDGTVRCRHCHQWTGSGRPLNRKKDHLRSCEAYAAWRAAGNGQEIPPTNPYNSSKRLYGAADQDSSLNDGDVPAFTPVKMRNKIPDLTQYFDESWDDNDTAKCIRARCKYCGAQRAKNPTRQWEHLQLCSNFLETSEGQQVIAERAVQMSVSADVPGSAGGSRDLYQGKTPNPGFKAVPRASGGAKVVPQNRPSAIVKPSLINYLLGKNGEALQDATQRPFLSHAGCGTLSAVAVEQFFTQQNHISRAFPSFIGKMIGKIRLPTVHNPQEDTEWRAFDLLVSTVNNTKRELEFLRTTKDKYGLQSETEPPRHAAKGLVDLMESATGPGASLLEGMIVLWAIEYLHHESWHYAERYQQPDAPISTSYSLPTYYQGNSSSNSFDAQRPRFNGDTMLHTTAISESLIPNWTSPGFGKFVDACRAIVDELANAQTTGNGTKELANAEQAFSQALWLWEQMWPEVTGMGEEENAAMDTAEAEANGGNSSNPIDVDDEDEDGRGDENAPTVNTPYGGLIAAASHAA